MEDEEQQQRPNVQITLYADVSDEELNKLRVNSDGGHVVLRINEAVAGNVFNRPFPFVSIREIPRDERLPDDLKNDGDPNTDYFHTLQSVRRERARRGPPACGRVFMGFKVLDNDADDVLDSRWKDWSGAHVLIRALSKNFLIRSVSCWKAVNVKPDVFKYVVCVEIAEDADSPADLLTVKDILQKFRIRRMSGYVALYQECSSDQLEKTIAQSSESLGGEAVIQNLSAED